MNNQYTEILNLEEKLRSKYKQEFVEENDLACTLFNIYLEARDINLEKWHLKAERRTTMELIDRTFDDLHAGFKLILEGMPVQGRALLRDTIECANHIKLFETDREFRDKWCQGEVFFPRDIQDRMKELDISPPPQNEAYKPLSRAYLHPSKGGVASRTVNYYSSAGEHSVIFSCGGVEDIPETRNALLLALMFTYMAICFVWGEMYPVDKDAYPQWYKRLAKERNRIYSLGNRVIQ